MAVATARPGRLRRRFGELEAVHYPLTVAIPKLDVPTAVTVHDLQHLDLPRALLPRRADVPRAHARGLGAPRRRVIVPSQFVRRRAGSSCSASCRSTCTRSRGASTTTRFRTGEDERERSSSTRAALAHKNHARLLQAFALLRARAPRASRSCSPAAATRAGRRRRASRCSGLVSLDELATLYRRAACLVFPSLYEGFGQPPLEAMASGCPVAASNIPAIAEACGDAAALFDPGSAEDIAAVVAGVLDAPDRFARRGSSGRAGSRGRRPPGGTRLSTVRWCSARRSRARPARPRPPSRAAGRPADAASRSRTRRGSPAAAARA